MFGYWTLFVQNALQLYTSNNPGQNGSTFAFMLSDFNWIDTRLRTLNAVAFFGNSSQNPARFPTPSTNWWAYLDDTVRILSYGISRPAQVQNKTGFSDIQALLDETTSFFVNYLENYNYLNLNPFAVASDSSASTFRPATVPPNHQMANIVMNQFLNLLPAGLKGNMSSFDFKLPGVGLHIRAAASTASTGLAFASTPATINNIGNITLQWLEFLYLQFGGCYWDGT